MAVEIWPYLKVVSRVQAQGNTKTIIIDPPYRNDPIAVVKVLADGKAAVVGEPTPDDLRVWPDGGYLPGMELRAAYRLQAGDDWLRTLSFVLRNRSAEKIAFLDIVVVSPQDRMKTLSEFYFGQLPPAVAYAADGKPTPPHREPISFKVGEIKTLALADNHLGLSRLDAEPLSSIPQVYVVFDVVLENGLQWRPNFWMKHDPEHPGHWIDTDGPYFPPNPASVVGAGWELDVVAEPPSSRSGDLVGRLRLVYF
jgi:hypothetical protein